MEDNPREHKTLLSEIRENWRYLGMYERFEYVIILLLSVLISVVILLAFLRLVQEIGSLILAGTLDILDYPVFQAVFGMIMTLLIAMEFGHSVVTAKDRKEHIIQVKAVLLIALLALSRKFIILDIKTVPASVIAALAFSVIALGVVYWLVRYPSTSE